MGAGAGPRAVVKRHAARGSGRARRPGAHEPRVHEDMPGARPHAAPHGSAQRVHHNQYHDQRNDPAHKTASFRLSVHSGYVRIRPILRRLVVPLLFGDILAVERVVQAHVGLFDLTHPLKQRRKQQPHAGVVVLFRKVRLQVPVRQLGQIARGQVVLQPHVVREPVVVVPDGQQHQHAVVFLARADLPLLKQLVGVGFDVGRAGRIQRDEHDLRAAGLRELVVVEHDQTLGLFRQHVRLIVYVEILSRLDHRRGRQRAGRAKRQHQRAEQAENPLHLRLLSRENSPYSVS